MPQTPRSEAPSSREKILETAEALFARHGFSGVGMRAVAEHVGLSKSSLFHHFPSKLGLYVALLERVMRELDAELVTAEGHARSAAQKLSLWIDGIVDHLAEHATRAPLLLRSLFEDDVVASSDRERLDEALAPVLSRIGAALQQGIDSREFRAVSVPHTIQTLIGMSVYHFASGEFGDDLFAQPIFSAAQIQGRKDHIQDFIRHALLRERPSAEE